MSAALAVASAAAAPGPVIPGSDDYGKTDTCVTSNGTFCFDWFKQRWGGDNGIGSHLYEHIELAAIAVVVGFVIAFALALLAYRARWLTAPITFATSLLYTIPSLAAFYILVPITGINTLTVESIE